MKVKLLRRIRKYAEVVYKPHLDVYELRIEAAMCIGLHPLDYIFNVHFKYTCKSKQEALDMLLAKCGGYYFQYRLKYKKEQEEVKVWYNE